MATVPFDPAPLRQAVADCGRLKREAVAVFDILVLPSWDDPASHRYPETLYGYMHRVFALVDLLSRYWRPPKKRASQTTRMVDFLERYTGHSREALNVAVQIWRHTLIHTARPRQLRELATGTTYHYLIQWRHISREQHFTFDEGGGLRILNLGVIHLMEDLERAATAFVAEIAAAPAMQGEAARYEAQLQSDTFRMV